MDLDPTATKCSSISMSRPHTRLVTLLAGSTLLLVACELSGPSIASPAAFGTIAADINGRRWISARQLDSVIAYYDPASGLLQIFGTRLDDRGRDEILSLAVCGPPASGVYSFANTWNGPYGTRGLALGAIVDWWQPADLPGSPASYTHISYGSTARLGDSLWVQELDLAAMRVAGRFRFEARSAGGTYTIDAQGNFSGRVAFRPGLCSDREA